MMLLLGDFGHIDFDRPIKMNEKQIEKFIEFLKTVYSVVETEQIIDTRTDRLGDKLFSSGWTADEYTLLLDTSKMVEEISEMLGRTYMSINFKRGVFISDFVVWNKKAGNPNIFEIKDKNELKKFIKEYMDENKKGIESRRGIKKEIKKLEKQKENLKDLISEGIKVDRQKLSEINNKIKKLERDID
ncbi:MAG: hypothetical protein KJ906_03465 [Nanoarchaeota archaeon]|nr:hypothetical protein [Nanoarchaeota archaeon]